MGTLDWRGQKVLRALEGLRKMLVEVLVGSLT